MPASFAGRVAMITGATSGIGLETARAFARAGAAVVMSGRRASLGERLAAEICAAGGDALFVPADVSRASDVQRLVDRAIEAYGRLDCAFNNAGVAGRSAATAEQTEEDWQRVIATNLTGVFLCMKFEIPELIKRPRSAIVNMASVAGLVGAHGLSAYAASKHGVIGLSRTAALDYAASGVRVNVVAPGVVRTDLNERAFFSDPGITASIVARHPLGRVGRPEEVAAAVLWLCSDDASFVTGETLAVDGGFLAK